MDCSLSFIGEKVRLRALEPEDIDLLLDWENDSELRSSSGSFQPISRKILQDYIESSHRTLFEIGQLRLIIQSKEGPIVGAVDLYDFDAYQRRVTIGIMIDRKYRCHGYAKDAVNIVSEYVLEHLRLYQIIAMVATINEASCRLFEACKFELVATLPKWQWIGKSYHDMVVYRKRGF